MSEIESPYINYVPTVHLSYTRKRYIDKRTNVRVNVDTNIQVVSANRLLFPYENPVKFDLSVIEFKSDNLKNLTAMISSLGIGSTDGFSKYILGLQQIKKKQHRISYESVNEFLSTDGY